MKKRLFSALVALCMVLTLLPVETIASGEETTFKEPTVTHLTVSYEGGEPVDLLGDQPTVALPTGSKPVFTVHFDNPDLLKAVYVTSTRDGETKYLQAELQGGEYVTNGYFDPDNTAYVPGTISVTYTKKPVEVTEDATISGIALDNFKAQLEAQGITMDTTATDTDGNVTGRVVLGSMFGAMAGEAVDVGISSLLDDANIDQNELDLWLGVYKDLDNLPSWEVEGAAGAKFMLYLSSIDLSSAEGALILVRDVTSNRYTKVLLKSAGEKLADVAAAFEQANLVSKSLLEYNAIHKDADALREEVAASVMTQEQKAEANRKIDDLERDRKLFLLGMTCVPLLLTVAGVGTPLVISALTAGYTAIADYFWQNRIGMIQGCDPINGVFSADDDHGIKLAGEKYGYTITQSGKYYCTENDRGISIGNADGSGSPINVTLCLHGANVTAIRMNNSSTLHICDCKFTENSDGSFAGGQITGDIYCGEGTVIIEEGTVRHSIELESNGTLIINGGYFHNSGDISNSLDDVINDGGQVTINGGTLEGSGRYAVDNRNGGITRITGGTAASVYNREHSEVTVTGGTVQDRWT